jgi:small subunit ribosomal protein S17
VSTQTQNEQTRGVRKERVGEVVSRAGDKTIAVKIVRRYPHPIYGKVVRSAMKCHAHDEGNSAKVGDTVRIVESRPMSRLKRWRVVEVLASKGQVPA